MKVVLVAVNGSYAHTNLAIRCLRPGLEDSGFDVTLAEFQLRDRTGHILDQLYRQNGDIYGFSVYIWNIDVMTELSRELKKIRPESHIVWGGPEVSFETERFAAYDFLDTVICGEGEITLPEVCRKIRQRQAVDKVIRGVPSDKVMKDEGILYREGENGASSLYYYESSRGCPFHCAYCLSSVTEGLRMKPVEQVLKDLKDFEKFEGHCRTVKFVDRTFNANPNRANAIWEALTDPGYTLKYHFEICATLLNEKSFEILNRMPRGKIQLEIGLQSTNQETLGAVSRHLDPSVVIEASRRILNMRNMDVYLDLIAGLPYEGIERFARSFDEAYDACTRLQVGFLKLLPGTELRRDRDRYGYLSTEKAPYTVLQTNWMTYQDLMQIHQVHEMMERYCESGKFESTLQFLRGEMKSPFRFWKEFADYIRETDGREIQKISQPDAYCLLLYYCVNSGYASRNEILPFILRDFELCENKKAPLAKWGITD